MSLTLTAAIAQCPASMFGDSSKNIPPKYRKIFARVVKALLADAGTKFDEATVDSVADTVNVSSIQRAVADHRKFLEEGGVKPPKKERGKTRPKASEDELGLGKSKKTGKKAVKVKKLKAKAPSKPDKKSKAAAPAGKTPAKAPGKPASGPKTEKTASPKLNAIAAARAALAAKKAAKAPAGKPAKAAEETVEI